jgi:hypothetical protein
MDDQKFDDIVKRKLADYKAPDFDASALSALHHRLDSAPTSPWYSQYRNHIIVGSCLALCTFMLLWSPGLLMKEQNENPEKYDLQIKRHEAQIDQLAEQVNFLTLKGKETASLNASLSLEIELLESLILKLKEQEFLGRRPDDRGPERKWVKMNYTSSLFPRELLDATIPVPPGEEIIRPIRMTPFKRVPENYPWSVKLARDLERHYRRGIGVRAGPTVELSAGMYKEGSGGVGLAGGFLGEFIFSPSFSLETGAKFSHRFYEITGEKTLSGIVLPNLTSDFGPLSNAAIDSWIVDMPINLKYRYPISMKSNITAGLGYSSVIVTTQIFEYDYKLEGTAVHVNDTYHVRKPLFYPGMINLSLGLNHQLKNKKNLETSIYYQSAIGSLGVERMKTAFFGIRSSYWFSVR